MSELLVHMGAIIMCPHAGQVSAISINTNVLVSHQPVVTQSDTYLIALCPFPPSGPPHPCVTVKWLVPSLHIKVNGQPVILKDSIGLCLAADQAPQGNPEVNMTQTKASGT